MSNISSIWNCFQRFVQHVIVSTSFINSYKSLLSRSQNVQLLFIMLFISCNCYPCHQYYKLYVNYWCPLILYEHKMLPHHCSSLTSAIPSLSWKYNSPPILTHLIARLRINSSCILWICYITLSAFAIAGNSSFKEHPSVIRIYLYKLIHEFVGSLGIPTLFQSGVMNKEL